MRRVLLRISRKSSWELSDPAKVLAIEFRFRDGTLDLSPSFYELPDDRPMQQSAVQAHAEHAASFLDTPRGGTHVDAAGIHTAVPVSTRGETRFRFTRDEAHRELRFANEDELRVFIEKVLARGGSRQIKTTREELLEYACARLDDGDVEWIAACATPPGDHWKTLLDKYRKKRGR